MPRHRVGPRLQRLLVAAMVPVGRQGAALPRLKIHHMLAALAILKHRPALQRQRRIARLGQQRQVNPKAAVGGLGPAYRLKHQVHRRAAFHGLQRVRHMREHTALRGHAVALAHLVQHLQQAHHLRHIVRGGVDADHRVAAAHQQAVDQTRRNARQVVGRVVGLQAGGQPPRQAQRVPKPRHHSALARHQRQVLHPAKLAHRRHHLRRQARRQGGQGGAVGSVAQQPIPKIPHRQVRHRRKSSAVVAVHNQPRHLVALVRHHSLIQKSRQRQLSQRHLRGHTLLAAGRRHTRQTVARAQRRSAGQQRAQVVKHITV